MAERLYSCWTTLIKFGVFKLDIGIIPYGISIDYMQTFLKRLEKVYEHLVLN